MTFEGRTTLLIRAVVLNFHIVDRTIDSYCVATRWALVVISHSGRALLCRWSVIEVEKFDWYSPSFDTLILKLLDHIIVSPEPSVNLHE